MRYLVAIEHLAVVVSLAASSAHATADGSADSWCEWNTTPAPFAAAWQVDNGFDNWMRTSPQVPSTLTHQDARGLAEIALENLARHGRAGVQARILTSEANCDPLSEPRCIAALTDAGDPWGCGFLRSLAYTHGSTKSVVFCVDHGAPMHRITSVLEHELGHAYGLNHVEAEPNCSSAPATDCAAPGTTDGCEAEKMCRTGCYGGGPGFAPGDAFGLRDVYFGTTNPVDRWINTGSAYLPGVTGFHFMSPAPGYLSTYAPRIDCARSTNPSIQCAVAQSFYGSQNQVRVAKLSGWSSSGWSTLGYTQNWNIIAQAPLDVALSDDASVAWITRSTFSASNNVQVRRINLATEGTTAVYLGYHSILPPRIVFYGTNLDPYQEEHALVIGVEGRTGQLSIGRWRLHHVTYYSHSGGLIAVPVDFGDLDDRDDTLDPNQDVDINMIVTDFDFDCESEFDGMCVLAAVLWDRKSHDPLIVNAVQRRRFRLPFGAYAVTMTDAVWRRDTTYRAQSVIGVSYANPRLYVSSGNFALGSGVNNTRVVEYSSSTSTTPASTLLHRGDYDTCTAFVTVDGDTISGATQHGGTSIAYCPSCNGGAGTLESVHFGDREASPYDYCF